MIKPISIQEQLAWAKKQKRSATQRATVESLKILLDKSSNPNSELYVIATSNPHKIKEFFR